MSMPNLHFQAMHTFQSQRALIDQSHITLRQKCMVQILIMHLDMILMRDLLLQKIMKTLHLVYLQIPVSELQIICHIILVYLMYQEALIWLNYLQMENMDPQTDMRRVIVHLKEKFQKILIQDFSLQAETPLQIFLSTATM